MVGVKTRYLKRSVCFIFTIIALALIIFSTTVFAEVLISDKSVNTRIVVYSGSNTSGGYLPIPPDVPLPPNITYSYRSPELGLIIVDTNSNETTSITNEILNLPWVYEVERDALRQSYTLKRPDSDEKILPDQKIFSRVGLDKTEPEKINLSDCKIAVIDTGFDKEKVANFSVLNQGYNWASNNSNMQDEDGHGTTLFGLLNSVSEFVSGNTNASMLSVFSEKIGDNSSSLSGAMSALAISHASDSGADIILMGYGGSEPSLAEERAVKYAANKGALLIAPAGDDDSNTVHYPSDNDEVISVGSIAATDGLSYFSNYGIYTELVAPGEKIQPFSQNDSCIETGTGYAAAIVCGIAGLVKETNPGLNSEEIRQVLQNSAKDLGRTGRDIYYGYGVVQADKALISASDLSLQKSVRAYSQKYNNSIKRQMAESGNTSTYSLELKPGWNFISVPGDLHSGKSISDVFSRVNTDGHTIWGYEKRWVAKKPGDLFLPISGILVFSERNEKIPLVYNNSSSLSHKVEKGWNLVGSPSTDIKSAKDLLKSNNLSWVSLVPFNSTRQQFDPAIINGSSGTFSDSRTIAPFSSFWIYFNRNGTIIRS